MLGLLACAAAIRLQREAPPSFQPGTINRSIPFNGQLKSSTIYENSSSTTRRVGFTNLAISNSQFLRCFASGATFTESSGGAIAFFGGDLTISSCTFKGNSAFNGGSIFLVDGSATLRYSSYDSDTAFSTGGSIYIIAYNPSNPANDSYYTSSTCEISHSTFTSCVAGEYGGSIGLEKCRYPLLGAITCLNCSAGYSGGALHLSRSDSALHISTFANNFCGLGHPFLRSKPKANRRTKVPKGGGAVFSYTEINEDHPGQPMELYVTDCCFFRNQCFNGATGSAFGGFDVFALGDVCFRAYYSAFTEDQVLSFQTSVECDYCETHPCDIVTDLAQADFGVRWNQTTRYSEKCGDFIVGPFEPLAAFPATETFRPETSLAPVECNDTTEPDTLPILPSPLPLTVSNLPTASTPSATFYNVPTASAVSNLPMTSPVATAVSDWPTLSGSLSAVPTESVSEVVPDGSAGGGSTNPVLIAFVVIVCVAAVVGIGLAAFCCRRRIGLMNRIDASVWERMITKTERGMDPTLPGEFNDPSVLETRLVP
jgi:hypothetical protein